MIKDLDNILSTLYKKKSELEDDIENNSKTRSELQEEIVNLQSQVMTLGIKIDSNYEVLEKITGLITKSEEQYNSLKNTAEVLITELNTSFNASFDASFDD